jgi:hypothetical protein
LFQEELDRAKSDQEYMEYFTMIDFAVGSYAYISASRAYPGSPALQNRTINGYMLWRQRFLIDSIDLAE